MLLSSYFNRVYLLNILVTIKYFNSDGVKYKIIESHIINKKSKEIKYRIFEKLKY